MGKLLGRGGMSSVFAATHRNGKKCAVKVLHPELAANARARQRFLREGYIANRVGHDGVVAILDDDVTEDGTVFLVMELLEGANLAQHLERSGGKLPPGEVLAISSSVLEILVEAHEKGIVHRDIKPENIFLTFKGELKLLDFGIASLRELSSLGAAATGSGTILGSPGFIAPEQARGRWKEIDARTDIWGLGATMFRLLTGRFVHEGETTHESVIATATRSAAPLLSVDASIGASLAAIVDRALESDPSHRWQGAADMRAALQKELANGSNAPIPRPKANQPSVTIDEDPETPDSGPLSPMAEIASGEVSRRRSGRQWLPYAIALLAAAALGVLLRANGEPTSIPVVAPRFTGTGTASESDRARAIETTIAAPIVEPSSRDGLAATDASRPMQPTAPPARASGTRRAPPARVTSPVQAPAVAASSPTRLEDVLNERN